MIEVLPRVISEAPDRPTIAGPNHPIRIATQEIATQQGAWTPERSANVAKLFDVLAPQGALIGVSSLGDATPIYLPPAEVEAALPGRWSGRTSDAGWGRWTVFRRA